MDITSIKSVLQAMEPSEQLDAIEKLRQQLWEISPIKAQPVDRIRWVPIDQVTPNDYNPNSVAKIELGLLYTSIHHDGYTQPIVTIWDDDKQAFVIVDGFHRYFTAKNNPEILERNLGRIPIVVIEKSINDRMASTVRHNRARGKHSIAGMSNMVFNMLENGWTEAEICKELGMEAEEVLRLKHITGFSKLFEDVEYKRAWESKQQMRLRRQAEAAAAT